MPLYSHVVKALDAFGLAYLHFIEPRSSGAGRAEVNHQNVPSAMVLFRSMWRGVLITAGGLSPAWGHKTPAAIPAITTPPIIPITMPREEPGFLSRGRPLGTSGETSCCASGSLMFQPFICCREKKISGNYLVQGKGDYGRRSM